MVTSMVTSMVTGMVTRGRLTCHVTCIEYRLYGRTTINSIIIVVLVFCTCHFRQL